MKPCAVCHKPQPDHHYHRDRRQPDGLHQECRSCKARADKARYNAMTDEQRTCRQRVTNARDLARRAEVRAERVQRAKQLLAWFTANGYDQRSVYHLTGIWPHDQRKMLCYTNDVAVRQATIDRLEQAIVAAQQGD